MISEKAKIELNKLISIAKKFSSNNAISESLFYDVVYPLHIDEKQKLLFVEYLLESGVSLNSGEHDVEDSDESADDSIKIEPYDTANIDISPKPLTLDLIIGRLENDEIDLLPDFQRKAGLWSNQQKSQLIESLILRIPLPAFYFDGSNNDKWIVIDGLQRLTALKEFFVEKSLTLSGMEFISDLNGTKFDDMPRAYERRMFETQITAYIINPGAPVNLKYNIFKRINTGGLRLEPQEIRHALFQGFATGYIKKIADRKEFKEATGYSVKTDRMLDREFVLRFIAFYEQNLTLYYGSIEVFLNNAMEILNRKYDPKKNIGYADKIEEKFFSVLKLSSVLFDKFSFRKMPDFVKRRPISKALFETWTSCLARLDETQQTRLKKLKDELRSEYMRMFEDDEFVESLSSAKVYSVKKRFEKIDELIRRVLSNDRKD